MLQADVIVPVYRNLALTRECLGAVLAHSGPSLHRLIVVNDCSPEDGMATMLRALRSREERVRVLSPKVNGGFVAAANLGLALCERDAVVLNSDARVTRGWLAEMLGALHEKPTLAALSPLSNNATFCSVPTFGSGVPVDAIDLEALDLSELPRVTEMPTAHGFCLLMRLEVLQALGLFDPAYGKGYNEENDWCQRAREAGFIIGRANRVFVFHHGEASFQGARARLEVVNRRRLLARYPRFLADCRRFDSSEEARHAARVVSAQLGFEQ